jgi:hypothetical protein
MSYFGVSTRNGVGLSLGTVPSLANTPLSYRLAPSLDLSFAGSDALSPAITFTRTTNATVTGSNGLIQNAPMNLLTFSEQFDNAAWSKTRSSISANTTAAPDGTTTADKVVEDTSASNTHQTFRSTSVSAGTPYTFSVYIKAAGRNFVGVRYENGGSTQFYQANVNLTNGTATTSSFGSPTGASFSVTSAGNDWWRVSITVTAFDASFASVVYLQAVQGTNNYTGDGVSGAFIWGAQLEAGSTATTYNPTTVKNLLGFTENFDNAAWTKSNAFVQTNLLINSVFANTGGAAPTGYTVGIGTGTSAPSGTANNGDTIYTQTAVAQRPFFSQNITTVVGVVYTQSIRITAASGVQVGQVLGVSGITPTYTLNGISVAVTALAASGVLTATWTATGTTSDTRYGIGGTGAATGSISFHGAQLVQGATPGDYKATYAAAAAVGYTDIYGQPFAQKLVENTASNTHTVSVAFTPNTSTPYTGTVYVKAAERQFAFVGLGQTSNNNFASIDLSTGVVSVASGSPTVSSTPLGNGWFRVSVTATSISTNSLNLDIRVSTDGVWDNRSYTGDGTSGIYIFGAQLSDSASVDPYVYQPVAAPASTAYYGPRFDYDPVTLQPKGLLIEEQRTNLLLNTSILGTQVVTVTAAAHTLSFYGTGTIVLSGAFVGTVTGTGAYPTRTTLTFTPIVGVLTVTVTGSVTSAQLEAGAFATSYIPTVASQVTRAADNASMIGNNFARWYNQTQGTLFVQGITSPRTTAVANAEHVVSITSTLSMLRGASSVSLGWFIGSASFRAFSFTSATALFKSAGAYLAGDNAATLNGGSLVTDSGSTYGSPSSLFIGANSSGVLYMNGTIARIAYYNRRLANTELQGITS